MVERVNATAMEVRWTALGPVEARGHITHYTISYWPASNSEAVMRVIVHNTTRVVIGGLVAGEGYVVQVSASTAVGEGEENEVTLGRKKVTFITQYYEILGVSSLTLHKKIPFSIFSFKTSTNTHVKTP